MFEALDRRWGGMCAPRNWLEIGALLSKLTPEEAVLVASQAAWLALEASPSCGLQVEARQALGLVDSWLDGDEPRGVKQAAAAAL